MAGMKETVSKRS